MAKCVPASGRDESCGFAAQTKPRNLKRILNGLTIRAKRIKIPDEFKANVPPIVEGLRHLMENAVETNVDFREMCDVVKVGDEAEPHNS